MEYKTPPEQILNLFRSFNNAVEKKRSSSGLYGDDVLLQRVYY